MSLINRKTLAAVGATAIAIATTALFATPAQAASAGLAKVVGTKTVQFRALMGKSNSVKLTISGRTVTITDKVAIQAGKGCKKVSSKKVRCTTSAKTTKLSVALGDKNDFVRNYTNVYLLVDAGTGNDTLVGGNASEELQGDTGNDKIYGNGGNDKLIAEAGDDYVSAGAGNDSIWGGSGVDKLYGAAGLDSFRAGPGNDFLSGGTHVDVLSGDDGNDVIYGGAGEYTSGGYIYGDTVYGGNGNDVIYGEADTDLVDAGAGNDRIYAGADYDIVEGKTGNDSIWGEAGNDLLAGDSYNPANSTPIGSASAADRVDGGANSDICLVTGKSTVANCEQTGPAAAGLSVGASDELSARFAAIRPAK
ncbi:calcium-binding protein [Actinoplanes sp. NPDC049802]|uniref:calcium-binding protein n=1 Tax=Actinoplanes sp. NPDC049802 TaxID=3154742 RepID=UPI0033FEF10A